MAARDQLRAYLSVKGNTETELCRASGVAQYTISRFLTGRIKSLTPEVRRFMTYANNGIEGNEDRVARDPRIVGALYNAWDGTDAGISLLASTINALAPVIRQAQVKGSPVGRAG